MSRHLGRKVLLLCFDIYNFGIARVEPAQLMAYRSGIAFLFEDLLPVATGRPPAVTAVIPAGDPCIGSRSKRNAVRHCALLSPSKGCCRNSNTAASQSSASNRLGPKKTHLCGIRPTAQHDHDRRTMVQGPSWLRRFIGFWHLASLRPFARTKREREAAGGPRPQLEQTLGQLRIIM